jgi:hypothetical protein
MSRRIREKVREWKSEHIAADDPLARLAATAQTILVRSMIATNRNYWRKYDAALARGREARALARRNLEQGSAARPAANPERAAIASAPNAIAKQGATR